MNDEWEQVKIFKKRLHSRGRMVLHGSRDEVTCVRAGMK
jgi:hypothetical protein